MENNDTKVLMERYEVGRLLGQGQFAKVHYARDLKTGNSVAIKIIDKEKATRTGLTTTNIKQEINIMRLVQHKNVLRLHEVLASKTKIYFVVEYAKGGELFQKVAKGRLKEDAARKYFHQLINAVDFCHKRGVYHRDLKPENLLLDGDGILKVSDFGLAKSMNNRDKESMMLRTMCGTPAYVAPEVVSRRGYDGAKADVWSCGVILYVMLAGYLPFHDVNIMVLYRKASNADFKLPPWFPPEVSRLVSRMLDPNPATRISIFEIRNDPWFRKGLHNDHIDHGTTTTTEEEQRDQILKPTSLNAFDIISFSTGLDLSGMFPEDDSKQTLKFVSMQSGSDIISKLESIAARRKLRIKKRDRGMLMLEKAMDTEEGVMKVKPLCVDAEVFEFTPFCHLVELRMSGDDDSMERWRIAEQSWLRDDLKDIVCSWID
ncbi:CBL-interacting protein kinase 2 [Linum grandiflorum]